MNKWNMPSTQKYTLKAVAYHSFVEFDRTQQEKPEIKLRMRTQQRHKAAQSGCQIVDFTTLLTTMY